MKTIRVLLADDHPLVLAAVSNLLNNSRDYEVVAAVTTPSSLINTLLATPSINVVITDYFMAGDEKFGDGIRLIAYLTRHFPNVHVIVLTMMSNAMIISKLYEIGVCSVLLKRHDMREVLIALNSVSRGRIYHPPSIEQDEPLNTSARSMTNSISQLTPKEYEVLRHFMRGESMTQIAANLKRSVKTISAQKISAIRKLNLDSDQALVAFCIESGEFQ
ncbi:MAG: response regulator transcription factor [Gammaproteobacteria bacterium]|nr:response regulator transcription factor [Gammaproteobacteria bacterium]MBU0817457.1 response regulator transcription factor [Gammaproteobacteria bacterium]MBU0845131.1 response regulator transcription factor [Gammaproteobacteria bacterium]MBU1839868.1 response regulator transcription factor [Gammaproteobacteria bacterium]